MRRAALLLGAALLAACAPPAQAPDATPDDPPTAGSATPAAAAAATDAADDDELAAAVDRLARTVAALRRELERARGGDEDALDAAADLLVPRPGLLRDPAALAAAAGGDAPPAPTAPPTPLAPGTGGGGDGGGGGGTAPGAGDDDAAGPLLPGPAASREVTVAYGDVLTEAATAARAAGGDGTQVLQLLGATVAGDIGAWQRAPGDQLGLVAAAAAQDDLDAVTIRVIDLPGEAPRALAWVVHGQRRDAASAEAADRALAHVAAIEAALDGLDG